MSKLEYMVPRHREMIIRVVERGELRRATVREERSLLFWIPVKSAVRRPDKSAGRLSAVIGMTVLLVSICALVCARDWSSNALLESMQ